MSFFIGIIYLGFHKMNEDITDLLSLDKMQSFNCTFHISEIDSLIYQLIMLKIKENIHSIRVKYIKAEQF
jgi:hypothetical protein